MYLLSSFSPFKMMEVCMSGQEEPKVEWWHSFMTAYLWRLQNQTENGSGVCFEGRRPMSRLP